MENRKSLRAAKRRSVRRNKQQRPESVWVAEALEQRQLLAGVTIVTHGFQLLGSIQRPDWIDTMAEAIRNRTTDPGSASIYKLRIGEGNSAPGPEVEEFVRVRGPDLASVANTNAEVIVAIDWSEVADWFSGYSTTEVASVATDYLFANQGLGQGLGSSLAQLPIHLIGHSRGASLVSEMNLKLGQRGLWVDQMTLLDPHPVPNLNDAGITVISNTAFVDNYYQTSTDPGGTFVTDAWNTGPLSLTGGYISEHSDVHLYYYGTIDTSANANNGDNTVPTTWYTGTQGPRATTGFAYSRLGGGGTSGRPLTGVSTLFGGNGANVSVVPTSPIWSNVGELRRSGGSGAVVIGSTVSTSYRYQFAGQGSSAVTLYYDSDRNPYNGTLATFSPTIFVPSTGNSTIIRTTSGSTYGRTPGTYYLCAKTELLDGDGQRTRWAYDPTPLQLSNPAPAQQGTAILGTSVGDNDLDWSDSGGFPNDNDGIIEARERPSLGVRIRSNAAISFIDATLSAASPDVVVTDPTVYFDDITAGGSGWSVGRFDMDLNFDGQRTINLSMLVTYRIGLQQYYQSLQISKLIYPNPTNAGSFVFNDLTIQDPPQIGGGNNNDGTFQSGERVDVIPRLRNNGVGTATGIEVYLTTNNPALEVFASDVQSYPDLGPGQQAVPNGGDAFRVRCVNRAFTGVASFDVHIRYNESPNEVVLTNGLQITIQPAPWLTMPVVYDFGVIAPGQNAVVPFNVGNVGSADFTVSSFMFSDPSMSATPPTPFPVTQGPPNNSRQVQVTIPTTGLSGLITRTVRVISNARLAEPNANLLTITGFVGNSAPLVEVPNSLSGDAVDISGTRLVWDDYRNGNSDIFLLDLLTNELRQLTSSPTAQHDPRISGEWVAWNQFVADFNGDVYAYNAISGITIPISVGSADEGLLGVSDGKIAYIKEDYTYPAQDLPSPGRTKRIYNIYVYDTVAGTTQKVTNYGPAVVGNPVTTSSSAAFRDADFDGDRLTWREEVHPYNGNGTWRDSTQNNISPVLTQTLGGSAQVVLSSLPWVGPVTSQGRVAWIAEVGNFTQVFLWQNGQATQLTTELRDHNRDDVIGIGSQYVAYSKSNVDGIFLWNLQTNAEELMTNGVPRAYALRMDNNGFGLKYGGTQRTYYGFIKQPEVGVSSVIAVSNTAPLEGESITVTPVIRNLSNFARTDAITVRLYDGNPDAGGTPIGSPSTMELASLAANAQQPVSFSNVTLTTAGQHQLFVRITMAGYDNPVNNTASVNVDVRDNDVDGPTISNVTLAEFNGDGDGVIGSDEQSRLTFTLTDPSGIGAVSVLVDGATVPVVPVGGGAYQATLGPISAGSHDLLITAADGDNSPTSRQQRVIAQIVEAERLALFFAGMRVNLGQTVSLGTFAQGSTIPPFDFTISNEGQQALSINSLSVPPGYIGVLPLPALALPGQLKTFTILPSTTSLGTNNGPASLASSAVGSPFTFNLSATVIAAPKVLAGAFRFNSRPHDIAIDFSDNVQASLTPPDLHLTNLDTGASIAAASTAIAYNSLTNRAIVTFPLLPNQTLADGNYRLVLSAGDITNQFGHPLQADYVLDFYVFAGDANRDRSINIADFATLASRFNQPGNFSDGDFNYSGTVEIGDFAIIASKFNTSLRLIDLDAFQFSVEALPQSAEPADINADGKLDLVVAHQELNGTGQGKVGVLLNTTPNGTLPMLFSAESQLFPVGGGVTALAVADFNADGRPDFATSDAYTNTVSVGINSTAPGSTTVSFDESISLDSGHYPFGITAVDLNADSRPDIIAANYRANVSPNAADTISVFMNTTIGITTTFAPKQDITVGDQPVGVESGDLDNDGKVDLAVINVESDDVTVLINTTPANSLVPAFNGFQFDTGRGPRGLAIADLNRDGKRDLVTANHAHEVHDNNISVLLNLTTPGSNVPVFATKQDQPAGGDPIDVAAGDLDADGADDLVVANFTSSSLSVFRNLTPIGSSTLVWETLDTVSVDPKPIFTAIRDVNQDGRKDITATSFVDTTASVTVLANVLPTDAVTRSTSGTSVANTGRVHNLADPRIATYAARDRLTGSRWFSSRPILELLEM